MDDFITWLAGIGAICIGIMALAIFFSILQGIKNRLAGTTKCIKIKKLFDRAENVTVHLSSGKVVSDVRFVGFTDPGSLKGVPYHLAHMAVFEATDGRRVLLRADAIRMMEEARIQED